MKPCRRFFKFNGGRSRIRQQGYRPVPGQLADRDHFIPLGNSLSFDKLSFGQFPYSTRFTLESQLRRLQKGFVNMRVDCDQRDLIVELLSDLFVVTGVAFSLVDLDFLAISGRIATE